MPRRKKIGTERLHADAKEMLEFMSRLALTTPELGTNREVSGADVVDALNPMWTEMRTILRRMRTRGWAQ